MMPKIAFIGLGYVGLTSALCFAESGLEVVGFDTNRQVSNQLRNGIVPIKEPKLQELLDRNYPDNFAVLESLEEAVERADILFLCINTPTHAGQIDLTNLKQALTDLSPLLNNVADFKTLVIKSTVVPGTTENSLIPLIQENTQKQLNTDFGVAVCPEFLREGSAVDDFMFPDRVVIGSQSSQSKAHLAEAFGALGAENIIFTTPTTSEIAKYASNAFFAMLVAFGNEIANISATVNDVSYADLFRSLLSDRRFAPEERNAKKLPGLIHYLYPGIGYGGSCFPKDLEALAFSATEAGYKPLLIDAIHKQNLQQPNIIAERIMGLIGPCHSKTLGFLGLSFKENSGDLRNSKAIELLKLLAPGFKKTLAHDPLAHQEAGSLLSSEEKVAFHYNLEETIAQSDILVLAVPWAEYRQLPRYVQEFNPTITVIDTRGVLREHDYNHFFSTFHNSLDAFK